MVALLEDVAVIVFSVGPVPIVFSVGSASSCVKLARSKNPLNLSFLGVQVFVHQVHQISPNCSKRSRPVYGVRPNPIKPPRWD